MAAETISPIRVEYDACEDGFSWHVIDLDGCAYDSCRTEAEALEAAEALREMREGERYEERLQAARDAISEAVAESIDLDLLERIRALLRA
jgi:hypothetical protein